MLGHFLVLKGDHFSQLTPGFTLQRFSRLLDSKCLKKKKDKCKMWILKWSYLGTASETHSLVSDGAVGVKSPSLWLPQCVERANGIGVSRGPRPAAALLLVCSVRVRVVFPPRPLPDPQTPTLANCTVRSRSSTVTWRDMFRRRLPPAPQVAPR